MKKHLWCIIPTALTLVLGIGALAACNDTPEATTYTLTYDLDGGTGEQPTGGSYAEGEIVTVASDSGLSKAECVFNGWLDGTTKVEAGSEYTMPARDVTLKADWKAVTYDVTYSLGDHAAEDAVAPAKTSAANGDAIELPATLDAAKGWTFAGWAVGTKSVPLSENKCQYTVSKDDAADGHTIAFTAQYTARQYNVKFEKGKVGDATVTGWPAFTGTVSLETYNGTITCSDAPVCDGWDFKGWLFNGENIGKTIEVALDADDLPDDDSTDIVFTAQWGRSFGISVSAGREKITVNITGEDDALANGATLVSMKAYQYYDGDASRGMSEDVSEGETVGTYDSSKFGEDISFEIDRVGDDQRDRLYDKYYLVKDGALLKGPYYVSKVTEPWEEGTETPEYMSKITSKKGIVGAGEDVVRDLGVQHVRWDFFLDNFYYSDSDSPSEPDATPFVLNGKTFYFRTSAVNSFDNFVRTYSQMNMDIIVVVVINGNRTMPDGLTYKRFGAWDADIGLNPIAGFNTSNEDGLEWWAATMEFFAQRYSGGEGSKGYISTYVIGNEVDFEGDYFRIAKKHQPIDTYVEEYGRCLRIADLAVKKYNPDIQVTTTLTHSWVEPGNTSNFNDRNYSPKELLDKLNAKSKREGDFNWGIAPHPYCYSLPASRMLEYDTDEGYGTYRMTGDVDTSSFLTYSNFEIIAQYLDREENRFEGKTRDVFLTESGISSSGYSGFMGGSPTTDTANEELRQGTQAAMVAYTWYKASQLDCVKVYAYYKLQDTWGEGGEGNFMPGLIMANSTEKLGELSGTKKAAYEVWKYIDTQDSFKYSMKYIRYVTYYDNYSGSERKFMTYRNGFDSYLDILDVFNTGYDFSNFDYRKAIPVGAMNPYEYV